MKVVIVESPAKAKTINKYLGKDYGVYASFGHVRDLAAKDGSVDPDDDFAMRWEVDAKAAKRLSDIGGAVKGADRVILATDPDREGEAISWHVHEILKGKKLLKDKRVDRVVFNAVTKDAVQEAMRHPREIDEALVDAYRARRALDYLVGFTLSPVLWRKLPGARSAGRVQSVALAHRLRPRARDRAIRRRANIGRSSPICGRRRRRPSLPVSSAPTARRSAGSTSARAPRPKRSRARWRQARFSVASVESKPVKRHPYPPFTTSTLQQEASRKLGLAPARTMQIAQRLYEGVDVGDGAAGLITYMRTDGVDLAPEAVAAARRVIAKDFGDAYVPAAPRKYTAKAKNAQEAHEAIRPTDMTRRPRDVARHLEPEQAKLYELIWTRTIACQMESAELERTTVDILAEAGARKLEFRATGQVVRFPGFLALYQEGRDDEEDEESGRLPAMRAGREARQGAHRRDPALHRAAAALHRGDAGQAHGGARHRPPLDLRLDHRRAASDRAYVRLEKKRLIPEDKGRLVTAFLESFFAQYVGYDFTADLEEKLDQVSNSEIDWKALLRDFWNDFSGAVGDIKDLRHRAGARQPQRASRAAYLPRARGRRRSAALPALRQGAIVAEARQIRRLHRLLELSRMQVHPRAGAERRRERRGRSAGRARARPGPGDRRGDHAAQRPLRRLRAAGRGREAQTLVAAARPRARRRDAGEGARAACRCRARSRAIRQAASRSWPASGATALTSSTARLTPISAATTTCSRSAAIARSTSSSPRRAGRRLAVRRRARGAYSASIPRAARSASRQGRFGAYVNHGKINATIPKGTDPASLTLDDAVALLAGQGGGRRRHRPPRSASIRTAGRSPCATAASAPMSTGARSTPRSRSRTAPDSITLAKALELIAEREGKPAAQPRKRANAPAKTATAKNAASRAKPASANKPAAKKAAAAKPKTAASSKQR